MNFKKRLLALLLLSSVIVTPATISLYAENGLGVAEEFSIEGLPLLESDGGKVTFTIKGQELKNELFVAKVKSQDDQKKFTVEEKAVQDSIEVVDNTSSNTEVKVSLTFPKNTTMKMKQYEINFSIKGQEEQGSIMANQKVKVKPSTTSEPITNEKKAILTSVTLSGKLKKGVSSNTYNQAFDLRGTDFKDGTKTIAKLTAKVLLDEERQADIETGVSKFDISFPNFASGFLKFPENTSGKDRVYKVYFNVDGSDKFDETLVQTVTVPSIAVTPKPDEKKSTLTSVDLNGKLTKENKQGFELKGTEFKDGNKTIAKLTAKVLLDEERQTDIEKDIIKFDVFNTFASGFLTFPKNETGKDRIYKVYFNVDGSENFEEKFVKEIIVPSTSTAPIPKDTPVLKIVGDGTLENNTATFFLSGEKFKVNTEVLAKPNVKVMLNGERQADIENTKQVKNVVNNFLDVVLTFPKNDTENDLTYKVYFNVDGSDNFEEKFVKEIVIKKEKADEPVVPEPNENDMKITELKVKTPNLPKEGGETKVTVKGENLESSKIKLEIFKIENGNETKIEIPHEFLGVEKTQTATLNFPASLDKETVYKLKLKDKEATVTVGGSVSGETVEFVPSNVYLTKNENKITLKFDEDVFAVKDIETLKSGISLRKNSTGDFEKLSPNDKVEIEKDKIVITLEKEIKIETGAKIKFEERLIKDIKNRENKSFEQFIKDSIPVVNEANFIKGEVLTKVGGNSQIKLIGENLQDKVDVKILKNNKDKSENSDITKNVNLKVEVVSDTEQTISFDLPKNETEIAETYSVMISLDKGLTYSSAIGVNVLENRAKRLVATVLTSDEITNEPTLSFMSIQSYGTSGGGTEQPDVTHTYTPVGQESKKTWVTMFGANLNKDLTKIKIIDENGVEWFPLQNEGTSDSMDNFIMVSADGTGIYGNGNTQMFELICPRNIKSLKNQTGDVTFKFLVAVDGKNFNEEIFVRATVVNDNVGKKESLSPDQITEIKVKHETEDSKEIFAPETIKGYKWSKLRSFNARPKDTNEYKAIKYKAIGNDGSEDIKEIAEIHEEKMSELKEVIFIYKKVLNLDELKEAIKDAKDKKDSDKYTYSNEDIKKDFDKSLSDAIYGLKNSTAQENIDNLAKLLKEKTNSLNGVKPSNPTNQDENNDSVTDDTITTITHENTGISVSGKNLSAIKLVVEKLNTEILELKDKDYSVFDISFVDVKTNKKVNLPVGNYTVSIPKEEGKVANKVFYAPENGNLEEKSFTQDDKYVTFTTTHFSKYVIEYKTTEIIQNNSGKDDSTTTKKKNSKKDAKKQKLAKTGISTISLLPTILLGLGSVIISKKRR